MITKEIIKDFHDFLKENNLDFNKELFNNFEKSIDNQLLTEKWYKSLENKNPDYSVYDDEFFLYASLDCYKKYSSKYIRRLFKHPLANKLINDCFSIVDMGNGLGYSTKLIKECLDDAQDKIVYGNNIDNSLQYKYNEYIGNSMIKLVNQQTECFIFFDFMEHIENPIEYIDRLICIHKPKLLIFANSFNTHCIGHFNEYKHNNEIIDQKKISRIFNKSIRDKGFEKVDCSFWNNRPMIFKLNN